jgi:hypothetical protein
MRSIFGDAPIAPQELFDYLAVNIPVEWNRIGTQGDSNSKWTFSVNETLCHLSEECKHVPYCKQRPTGEWLLDMVWLNDQLGIGLAAECEWITTDRAISDDFEKLLYFKAPLKLFIFQASHDKQSIRFRQTIQLFMDRFEHHVKGEQYVLFEVRGQHAYGYWYEVQSTGKLPPVAFQEINKSPRKFEW